MPGITWFKFCPKDVAMATDGLSLTDFAIAVKLMGHYASTGKPLDIESHAGRYGEDGSRVAVVLRTVFTYDKAAGGWIYEPIKEQIDAFQRQSEINAANASKRNRKKATADHSEPQSNRSESLATRSEPNADGSESETNPLQKQNTEAEYIDPPKGGLSARDARARTRTRAAAPRLDFYDLPENLIGDWQTQRKAIRAPITQTVIDGFKREAEKAGISLEQAVRFALERNWQGFRASWWKKSSAEEGADAPDVNAEEEAFYSWKRDEYAAGRIPRIEFEEWREKYWLPRQKEMPE